jgi:hypothetical protein
MSISRAIDATRIANRISSMGAKPAVELADEDRLGDGAAVHAPTSKAAPKIAATVWSRGRRGRPGEISDPDLGLLSSLRSADPRTM